MKNIFKLSLLSLFALPSLAQAQMNDRAKLRYGPNYPPAYSSCATFDIISSNGV